jgi:type I restriction enzyme S subunit
MANHEKSGHRNRGKGGQRMKYEEYKDSGVEWIGEVPSHWEVKPIKRTGSFENGLTYSPTDICEGNGVLVLRSSNIQNDKLSFEDNVYVTKCPSSLMVRPGDIIICSRNGSASLVGKCAMVEEDINASYGAFMMRYRPICDSNKVFSFYLLQTALKCYKGLYSTTTINQLTKGVIGQIYVSYPPLPEQQAIAAYLDEKCGEINRAIDVQKKKIELLDELKQTIITDAVTKGLNPNAPMKDSGVEWIGKVPEHWKVMKTSLAFTHIGSGTTPSTSKNEYYEDDGDFWLQTGDLTDSIITDTSKKVSKIAIRECNLKFYPTNSVVIAMYGATIGKMGLLQIECATNQACCVLPSNNHIDAKFTFYFFLSAKTDLLISAIGGGQPNISQDVIKKTKMIVPPLSEQQTIANYLDEECTKIDVQISNANHRIELLNELKQSIINEAVTGKIKVC